MPEWRKNSQICTLILMSKSNDLCTPGRPSKCIFYFSTNSIPSSVEQQHEVQLQDRELRKFSVLPSHHTSCVRVCVCGCILPALLLLVQILLRLVAVYIEIWVFKSISKKLSLGKSFLNKDWWLSWLTKSDHYASLTVPHCHPFSSFFVCTNVMVFKVLCRASNNILYNWANSPLH